MQFNDFTLLLNTVPLSTCTMGRLTQINAGTTPDHFIGYSMERAWLGNEPFISCIPKGEYIVSPHVSPKFGDCYIITSVKQGIVGIDSGKRTHILFHSANRALQLHGCIALGSTTGILENQFAVFNSKKTINEFYELLGNKLTRLTIKR